MRGLVRTRHQEQAVLAYDGHPGIEGWGFPLRGGHLGARAHGVGTALPLGRETVALDVGAPVPESHPRHVHVRVERTPVGLQPHPELVVPLLQGLHPTRVGRLVGVHGRRVVGPGSAVVGRGTDFGDVEEVFHVPGRCVDVDVLRRRRCRCSMVHVFGPGSRARVPVGTRVPEGQVGAHAGEVEGRNGAGGCDKRAMKEKKNSKVEGVPPLAA